MIQLLNQFVTPLWIKSGKLGNLMIDLMVQGPSDQRAMECTSVFISGFAWGRHPLGSASVYPLLPETSKVA